jgi:transposase
VTAYENHEGSMRQLATRFRLSLSCGRDLLTRYRATGDVAPKPHGGGYPAKLGAAGLDTVQTLVQQDPDATLKELCMRLQATTQLTVSAATMSRVLTKLGLPRKKTFRAAEQERPDIQRQRAAFFTRIQQMAPDDLLFLDESGSNQAMTRAYVRAPRGQRAHATKPVNCGVHLTMVAALGLEGVGAAMTVEGFTDGAVFLAFLHDVLLSHLRPGQVVILDNLKTHKVVGMAEAIATAEARLLYLPPTHRICLY